MTKKYILAVLLLSLPVVAFAEGEGVFPDNTPVFSKSIPFTKKLDRTTPFIALEPGSIVSAQNMKRPAPGVSAGWTMRAGMTKHNTTSLGAATINSLHQYINKDIGTRCFFAQYNSTGIYQATNDPPTAGTTFGSSVYTATGATAPAYSSHVGGDWVGAATGAYPWAWSGGTAYPDGFYVDHDVVGGENAYDNGYRNVRNIDTASYITFLEDVAANNEAYIGFRRPLSGFYLYFLVTNSDASTMTVSYWKADATPAWEAITTGYADGTASGGATMAKNGAVTWTDPKTSEAAYLLPGTRNHLYWYKITINADITNGVKVYECTVAESLAATITNLWSGYSELTLGCFLDAGAGYVDYTGEVTDGTDATYISLDSMATSSELYVGFSEPAFGVSVNIVNTSPNENASYVIVKYWDASADNWVEVGTVAAGTIIDGTSDGTAALAQTGTITWTTGSNIVEDQRMLGGITIPLYWYQLTWSATLDADTQIWELSQAMKPATFPKYNGVIEYNGRALWWPGNRNKNGIDYSQIGYAHIFNGPDAGSTGEIFGPGEVNAVANMSSYAFVSTKNPYRMYLLQGKVPSSFDSLIISAHVGVVAPKTLVVIDDGIRIFNTTRTVHAGMFLAPDGFYMSDGMTVTKISQPIEDYFNSTAPYIEPSTMSNSYAWINYAEKTVHFAVPINTTGTGTQSTLNKELVYSYITDEWYDTYLRASPASCGMAVDGSNNQRIVYIGDYAGYVHLTNTGTADNGTKITHNLTTSSIIPLDGEVPDALNYSSTLRSIKIKAKADTVTNSVATVTVYPDGKTTGVSAGSISLENTGYSHVAGKKAVNQNGDEFAFKFEADLLNSVMELYGFTINYMAQRPE